LAAIKHKKDIKQCYLQPTPKETTKFRCKTNISLRVEIMGFQIKRDGNRIFTILRYSYE